MTQAERIKKAVGEFGAAKAKLTRAVSWKTNRNLIEQFVLRVAQGKIGLPGGTVRRFCATETL